MHIKHLKLLFKKQCVLFGLFVVVLNSIIAQNNITTTQFLNDINVLNHKKTDSINSLLKKYNYKESIINSVQFRSETNDFQLKKQEYTLRVKPNNPKIIKSHHKIFLNKVEEAKLENEKELNKQLINQYFVIIDFVFTNKLIELYQKKELQLKDKLTILKQQIYHTNFDVNDLIETEEDLQNIALKFANLKDVKVNLIAFINQYLNTNTFKKFNLTDFIKPEQIIEIQSKQVFSENNIELSLQELKLNQIENQLQLETSKSKQLIDYFQTKYVGKNNFLKENISLGIGVNLPFFGNSKRKKGMYLFDKLNATHKIEIIKKDVAYKNELKKNELKKAILNYKKIKKQKKESSVTSLLNTYKKMDGISPLTLLKMELLIKKKEIEQVKTTYLLYKSYLDLLAMNEILFQKPFKNYLTINF